MNSSPSPFDILRQERQQEYGPIDNQPSEEKISPFEVLRRERENTPTPSPSPENQVQGVNQNDNALYRKAGVVAKGAYSGGIGGLIDSAAALGNATIDGGFSGEEDENGPAYDNRTIAKNSEHSATTKLGKQVNELFGTNLDPQDAFEKFLYLAGAFSVPIGGGIGKQVLSGLGSAAGIVGAEEAGIDNPLAQLAAGVAGGAATLATPKLVSGAKNLTAKATGYSPKNIDLNAVETAERLGVELPNTAASTSTGLANVEQLVQRTPWLGNKYNKKLQTIDEVFAGKVKESFDQIGDKLSSQATKGEVAKDVGKQAQEVLSDFSKTLKEESALLYQEAEKLIPQDATFIPNKTIEAINNLRDRVKKSFSPTTDEQYVMKTIDEIENNLLIKSQFGDLKVPPKIENLQATKRSLNDKINWDINAAGTKNQLKKVRGAIEEDLAAYGLENQDWYKAYKNADNFYGKYFGDEGLKSKPLQKILNEANPEQILGNLKTASDFKYIENVVSKTPQGKDFFNSLKREKFESLMGERVLDKLAVNSTDSKIKVNYNPLSKILDDPQKSTLIKYLVGDSNFNKVKDLVTYSKAMVGRAQRNPNTSGTSPTSAVLNWIITVFTSSSAGAGAKILGATSPQALVVGASVPYTLYKLVSNKKLLNYAINTAKAAKEGNIAQSNKWGGLLDKSAQQVLGTNLFKQLINGNIEEDQDN